ncbi:MAG: leucine-rich repeat domain-containing protein [Alphaproteobacteria bacterium]|nr:leucine-rich repeat domain-containing protein [Alphaproteobacteria bacterium]
MTEVTLRGYISKISKNTFSGCKNLTTINYNILCTTIEDSTFSSCSSLKTINIGTENEYVNNIYIPSGAFSDCTGLTSIKTMGKNNITIGDRAFSNCTGLTEITLSNSVGLIDNAFDGCSGLTSITIESGNNIYDSRDNCNAIIETATNTLITGCQNTIIPNSVTEIGYSAFYGCSSLTEITIPNSVTSIGYSAFYGCSSLTEITIPNSVTSIGYSAFYGCSSLTSIVVESGNRAYDSRDNCNAIIETARNILIKGCQNTIIPNSVTDIWDGAFENCTGLTEVTIPYSVSTITNSAFCICI